MKADKTWRQIDSYNPPIFPLLLWNMFFSWGKKNLSPSSMTLPDHVGEYLLERKLTEEVISASGIYKSSGNKILIKFWKGSSKNYGYYALVREFFTTKLLYQKIRSTTNIRD